ncbi:MAG: LytR C-terminal domain-containing protein [Elusimicrobia bacterium]|nr:LytR C-terminal domain-containing protein [Elusimicrobiota bacterium]
MRETLIGRTLAAALLAGALALAWLQSRSSLAKSLAEGLPIPGQLTLHAGPYRSDFLAVYQPRSRTLDVVYPAPKRDQDPAWILSGEFDAPPGEPPIDAADWFLRHARRPGTWLGGSRTLPWLDRLLLFLEFERLGPDSLRPAWLPPDVQAAGLLDRLIMGADVLPAPDRITVEVLNSTAQSGVASRAKNILRLGGADVMSVGNAAGAGRTVVYDRTGRFESAAAVRRMLGCPAARAATQVDLRRLVDVSVVLAGDCPLP